ncbi:DNA-deoxyinosine glycosylase [Uliginosibacterium gangwonense]|uniref:DNA-deoxyinosine glycosylase n=1 Tax=Uliginosibacterium gangwonense TaxID=392736 RepID=UPI00036EE5BF|nr:DNA-deoxyinosine glycosylase [Uliginosibacterium gangwonense]
MAKTEGEHIVESFPPVAEKDARILILGSMPSLASLRAEQYYAHPQNLFWKILGEALGFDPRAEYSERIASLQAHQIAVWDVLARCHRPGSLDADIDAASAIPNDLPGFLAIHPHIQRICFNGAAAAQLFQRHIQPQLSHPGIEYLRLPSTSPANASIPVAEKKNTWATALKIPESDH